MGWLIGAWMPGIGRDGGLRKNETSFSSPSILNATIYLMSPSQQSQTCQCKYVISLGV